MPATSIQATTTHELQLKPAIKKKLMVALREWEKLHLQEKEIKAKKAVQAKTVEEIQTDLEESSLSVEGYKSTLVAPMRSKLDKKMFVRLGGRLDLLEKATRKVPGESYVKITPPGTPAEAVEGDDD